MKWHKGPPPEIGWWPASVQRDKRAIRWWDGKRWSWPVEESFTAYQAAKFAKCAVDHSYQIEWTDRWWL